MAAPTVTVEKRGIIALVTLDRPESNNAINLELSMDLLAAALACERDSGIRAVVLTGAGRNFSFGGDLRSMLNNNGTIDAYLRELTTYLNTAIARFMRMDAPVIAAITGTVAGAGVGLAAMADLSIAADNARFNLAYTGVGLTPDAGVSFLVPRAIGSKRAMEMLLLNRTIDADEALAWGLVNQVVPADEVLETAISLAERLAAGPLKAFGQTKRLVALSLGALESQLAIESETIAVQAASAEGIEGITAFLDKRKPSY
jgi:2-(1,2-epoxy-1,2-dihydrophenyl)acetyl-CoA isomerase